MWSLTVVVVLIAHTAVSLPDGDAVANPSPEYGPPKAASAAAASSPSAEPDTMYGPPPDTEYGPPGFTPGEPLDHYSSSSNDDPVIQIAPVPFSACLNNDLASNKQLVLDFYQNVFGDKRFDLVERYVAKDVINHNPMEADGIESLRELLKGPLGQGPRTKVDFKRISAEGDLVWLHSRIPVPALNVTYAIVDIFRINCKGLVQEHWDVIQDTNVESKNSHPFF